jgi:SAM-dependent methyltransferase
MIRTASARRRALAEASRILKPGGRLVLHAHNIWLNLRSKQGREWLWGRLPSILLGSETAGDRRMTYRRVPGMEVHLYQWGELRREIRAAGLRIDEIVKLDEVTAAPIRAPWFLHSIRAGGWILFCRRK